jgi:hypothetical protein
METVKLATAGDDIRIWDANIFSLEKQLNLHKQSTLSVAWSRTEPVSFVLRCSYVISKQINK